MRKLAIEQHKQNKNKKTARREVDRNNEFKMKTIYILYFTLNEKMIVMTFITMIMLISKILTIMIPISDPQLYAIIRKTVKRIKELQIMT